MKCRFRIGVALSTVLLAIQAQAAERIWINPAGGSLLDPANWNQNLIPTFSSDLRFDLNATYTLSLPANLTVFSVLFNFGDITLDMGGHTFGATVGGGGVQIGGDSGSAGRLTLRNGTFQPGSLSLSDDGNTQINRPSGYLAVLGATTRVEVETNLSVGFTGPGELRVNDGAVMTVGSGMVMAPIPGAFGLARVVGTGSSITTRDLFAAGQGTARLLIDAGASFATSRIATIGFSTNANAQVVIRGAGSTWTHTPDSLNTRFVVGESASSSGVLAVLDGGHVTSADTITVTSRGTLMGNSVITAAVSSAGLVSPGGSFNDATNNVVSAGIGALRIEGTFAQTLTGILAMDLGSSLPTGHDLLQVTGAATLTGKLRVSLVNGFVPANGSTFELLSAASISGTFSSLELPALSGGLSLQVHYSPTNVTVSVIPTPAAMAAGVFGLSLLARRRRLQHESRA